MTVFANGLEVACKAQSNQVIAAFPDVCMTPPENPATPPGVPVPYPSFGSDSDTDSGTGTVKIGGKTITHKNKSYYTKTTGTEAGCAAKKGVITSVNTGKEYAVAWSNDVKADGEPVSRFTDVSTNNHASPQGQTPPWPKVATKEVDGNSCADIVAKIHPYSDADNCPSGSQSHHIVDNASFTMTGARKVALKNIEPPATLAFARQARNLFQPDGNTHPGVGYDEDAAPCICLKGKKSNPRTQHGKAHDVTESMAASAKTADGKWTYKQSRDAGVASIEKALNLEPWECECLKMVLDSYYKKKLGCTESTELVAPPGQASATHFNDGRGNMVHAYGLT